MTPARSVSISARVVSSALNVNVEIAEYIVTGTIGVEHKSHPSGELSIFSHSFQAFQTQSIPQMTCIWVDPQNVLGTLNTTEERSPNSTSEYIKQWLVSIIDCSHPQAEKFGLRSPCSIALKQELHWSIEAGKSAGWSPVMSLESPCGNQVLVWFTTVQVTVSRFESTWGTQRHCWTKGVQD